MKHEVVEASFKRQDARGTFIEATNRGPWQGVIYGRMKAGAVLGHHYHKQAVLLFFVTSGVAEVSFVHAQTGERDALRLEAGQGVRIEAFESHAVRFLSESEFLMLKSVAFDAKAPDIYELRVEDEGLGPG